MEEKIDKIQLLVEGSNADEKDKKIWSLALRELKKLKFPEEYNIDVVLESVYLDAKNDINVLNDFFQKIGSFVYAYVKGGDGALGENIDRSIKELDQKLEELG
ncbi:MAG: hypothetical protein WC693_04290 [Patescibacteria group bacterium]